MVSGSRTRSPSYALVPGAQSARQVSIVVSSRSSRSAAAGKGSPYAACSRSHQPAPMPRNARPPESASRVAAAFAVTPAGRNVAGVHERAQLQPGVQAGDQAEGHPGLGDRLPGGVDLGDLDQVVHQRQPGEPRLVRRQRHLAHPAARVLAPGEPRELEHHLAAVGRRGVLRFGPQPQCSDRSGCGLSRVRSPAPGDDLDVVPALGGERRGRTAAARRTCSARTGAGTGRSRRALRRRHSSPGVSSSTATAGSPAARAASRQAIRRVGVQAEGVDDGGQPAGEAGGDDAFEEVEGVRRGVEVGGAGPDDAAQVVGRDDLGAAVVRRGPRWTCPTPRRR